MSTALRSTSLQLWHKDSWYINLTICQIHLLTSNSLLLIYPSEHMSTRIHLKAMRRPPDKDVSEQDVHSSNATLNTVFGGSRQKSWMTGLHGPPVRPSPRTSITQSVLPRPDTAQRYVDILRFLETKTSRHWWFLLCFLFSFAAMFMVIFIFKNRYKDDKENVPKDDGKDDHKVGH